MPYIKKERRKVIVDEYGNISPRLIDTAGELNFAITELIVNYMINKDMSYQTVNDIVGALTCAKDEFERRVTSNYEDLKIVENGDVY